MKKDIHVAHSPDSDDAFMFYALATRKIDTGDLNYVHTLGDIETLNRKAMKGEYEVSAVSFHAYAYMADKYARLGKGGPNPYVDPAGYKAELDLDEAMYHAVLAAQTTAAAAK